MRTWAARQGLDDYRDRIGPLSLEHFLAYADWFTGDLVPGVRDLTVTGVTPAAAVSRSSSPRTHRCSRAT